MKNFLCLILLLTVLPHLAMGQNPAPISYMEYWFNDQNGEDDRMAMTITESLDSEINFHIETADLNSGQHTLHYRVKNAQGVWTPVVSKSFIKRIAFENDLIAYEYWFDDVNNESSRVKQNITQNATFELNQSLQSNTLARGEHTIHYRTQNLKGEWSTILSQVFQKQIEGDNDIIEYQYWINNDLPPISVNLNSAQNHTLDEVLDIPELDSANYAFKIRFKDLLGRWSAVLEDSVLIDTQPILCFDSCYLEVGSVLPCANFIDSDMDGICDVEDETNGDCTLGSTCNDGDDCTINDVFNEDCQCIGDEAPDSDMDGICDPIDETNGDCILGATCDDGDNCTINDVFDSNCNCSGIFQDSDMDGLCDAEDLTNGDCQLGQSCDDGDDCTIDDVLDSDCNCIGTFEDSDMDGICDAEDETNGDCTLGSTCNDGDDCTINDVFDEECQCIGEEAPDSDMDGICDPIDETIGDCILGATCDDEDECTIDDIFDSNCQCLGIFLDTDEDTICDAEDVCPGEDDTIDDNMDGIPDCIVGIKEITHFFNLIYPNPFSNELIIEIKSTTPNKIELYNSLGQHIALQFRQNQNIIRLDTSSLPAGIYVLSLIYNEKILSKTIVKN